MKIRWSIGTGYVMNIPDWTFEIPDEEVEGLSEHERNMLIDEYMADEWPRHVSIDWEIDKEKDG